MAILPHMFSPAFPRTVRFGGMTAGAPRSAWLLQEDDSQGVQGLIAKLGSDNGQKVDRNGLVSINEPLIKDIVGYQEQAIPELKEFFSRPQSRLALVEGIYAAQKLAENKVSGVETLYGPISRYNASPDPLIQTYLAGFYRTIDEPAAFGPMLGTLIHQSVYYYPSQGNPNANLTEEVGGTVLEILARESAKETLKALQPYFPQIKPVQSGR